MTNLTRWKSRSMDDELSPITRLRDEFFDRLFTQPFGALTRIGHDLWPRVDVLQGEDDVTVRAELPGVKAEDIHIEVSGDKLTMRGEKCSQVDEKGRDFSYCESEYGTFFRTIDLPLGVDPDKVDATFADGVLSVKLGKRPDAKAKRITIKGNGAGAIEKTATKIGPKSANRESSKISTISRDELSAKINRHESFQLINVLEPEHYSLGMLPNSMRIPVSQLERRVGELDRNKEVIVYCASYDCPKSAEAAEFLAKRGYKVRAYEGGIREWKEAGLPMG